MQFLENLKAIYSKWIKARIVPKSTEKYFYIYSLSKSEIGFSSSPCRRHSEMKQKTMMIFIELAKACKRFCLTKSISEVA